MKEKQTPLMRQYNQIKSKYPETVLLFRLGDFFETFGEDALITSKACGITLTKRNNGAAGEMPLAGFPHHQLDTYLPRLVRSGHRVAVCEQLEDPKQSKGVVKRGVVEVVTPGVALYDKLLDTAKNNYISAVIIKSIKRGPQVAGIAFCDISTGEFFVSEVAASAIIDTLESISPNEIIISKEQRDQMAVVISKLSAEPSITRLEDWIFEESFGREILLRHFETKNLKGFGIENFSAAIAAAGAALHYISESQQTDLPQISKIGIFNPAEFMALDFATRRNLEISYSMIEGGQEGSLISILDRTLTPMGGRLFKKWITRPLKDLGSIRKRLDAVDALYNNRNELSDLRNKLDCVGDLERLISKIGTGRANPRDVIAMKNSLGMIPDIKSLLSGLESGHLKEISGNISSMDRLVALIGQALVDEPSSQVGGGGVFRPGFSADLDEYANIRRNAKQWLVEYQESERSKSGINSLKVGVNSVFGYYIEVTKTHSDRVPDYYDRKQTLRNAERYITPELKEFETKILNAEEKIHELEHELFRSLRAKIALETELIQENAFLLANTDCLQSMAQVSIENNYIKPEIDESEIIDIKGGRHPVVEKFLPVGDSYSPNSTLLDTSGEMVHILTGPNMSGKSCYLRQVALIVLMGQVGCFVPAESARFGVIDRIYTRVGAQDNIAAGESTFLVEMQEAANILNNATGKSLILLDEVGRGTATYDGISLAWSIAEYIHNKLRAKTLFATHYHELNELAERYENIANYKVEVIEAGDKIVFTHNVKSGASDHSFGIHVARLAGMPEGVIGRANEILGMLENSSGNEQDASKKADLTNLKNQRTPTRGEQLAIFEFRDDEIREKLKEIDINSITPVDAISILSELTQKARE
jgi:DNA mismatch repair protein MutS